MMMIEELRTFCLKKMCQIYTVVTGRCSQPLVRLTGFVATAISVRYKCRYINCKQQLNKYLVILKYLSVFEVYISEVRHCPTYWYFYNTSLSNILIFLQYVTVQHTDISTIRHCPTDWYFCSMSLSNILIFLQYATVQHTDISIIRHCPTDWYFCSMSLSNILIFLQYVTV